MGGVYVLRQKTNRKLNGEEGENVLCTSDPNSKRLVKIQGHVFLVTQKYDFDIGGGFAGDVRSLDVYGQ